MTVAAIRNIASQKIFILVETHQDKKMTIINPEGKMLTVPDGLFEKPFLVSDTQLSEVFTHEQIEAIAKNQQKRNKKAVSSASGKKVLKKTQASLANRTGLGNEWNSQKLIFYKHNIEPLGPRQSFRINIEDVGVFEITKEVFEKNFNDVIISTSYWHDGSYVYNEIPEKAYKFIKSK